MVFTSTTYYRGRYKVTFLSILLFYSNENCLLSIIDIYLIEKIANSAGKKCQSSIFLFQKYYFECLRYCTVYSDQIKIKPTNLKLKSAKNTTHNFLQTTN